MVTALCKPHAHGQITSSAFSANYACTHTSNEINNFPNQHTCVYIDSISAECDQFNRRSRHRNRDGYRHTKKSSCLTRRSLPQYGAHSRPPVRRVLRPWLVYHRAPLLANSRSCHDVAGIQYRDQPSGACNRRVGGLQRTCRGHAADVLRTSSGRDVSALVPLLWAVDMLIYNGLADPRAGGQADRTGPANPARQTDHPAVQLPP